MLGEDKQACIYNSTQYNCSATTPEHPEYRFLDIGTAASYVAIVSCCISCLGSALIIITYFLLKDMRTGSQKIITLLAVADLISAIGYILGSSNFIGHYHSSSGCDSFNKLCEAQATITTWSSLASFWWTVILAMYFFLIIVFKRTKVASKLMILYNFVAWGSPLLIVVPLLCLRKFGYSHYAASNWCFIKNDVTNQKNDPTFNGIVLVAGKLWEILSYVIVIFLYLLITIFIGKTRRQIKKTVLEQRVLHVETRLLAIPVIFVLLRIWGTIQFIFSVGMSDTITKNNGCVPNSILIVYKVFGILQAIGDGGQGWGNAICYILLSPVMRSRLVGEWCGTCVEKLDDHLNGVAARTADHRSTNTGTIIRRANGLVASKLKSDSQENLLDNEKSSPGVNAVGYGIVKYETTSATEGVATGSSIAT